MNRNLLFSLAAIAASCAAADAVAAVSISSGYRSTTLPAGAPGSFIAGMDLLPTGNLAVFDGSSIVELDKTNGAVVTTIYTPAGFVFGSFVQTSPNGQFLLFGNSTNDQIVRIPLAGGAPSAVATIHFAYDLAFVSDGVALVSAATIPGHNQIVRLDIATGATDVIADFIGASGPLAIDRVGNLYYCEAAATFPPPPGAQRVLRFDASQVASAIGPNVLTVSEAAILVTGVTTASDMVIDEEGDVILALDPNDPNHVTSIREYEPSGLLKSILAESNPFDYVGPLAFKGNGTAAASNFGAFQPENGGTLAAISTDFFNFTDVDLITPKRATLETNPPSPIPLGNFTFDLDDGPAFGYAIVLVAAGSLPQEIPAFDSGVAYMFGINPGTVVLALTLPLDGNGEFSIPATNHGTPGTVYVQAALLAPSGGVGTTTALTLTLQ